MSIYQWKGAGYGGAGLGLKIAYEKTINIPDLISLGDQSGLALVAAPNTGVALASTGFGAADILEVFWLPKGTIVRGAGVYRVTAEGGTATIDVGYTSSTETNIGTDVDFLLDGTDMNTTGLAGTGSATVAGDDDFMGETLFKTNGSVDILFNNAMDTAVFKIWLDTYFIGDDF